MTPLLARLKQAAKWAAALAILVATAAWALLRYRRRQLPADPVDEALTRWERTTELASAKATVEIAAARAKSDAERAVLVDALRDAAGGEDAQIDRLIKVGRRIREGR